MLDPAIADDLPNDIEVLQQPIWEPYSLASLFSKKKTKTISAGIISEKKKSLTEKMLLWVRGNLFIPDARKYWAKPSIKYLTKYVKDNDIQTVITTSPPHSIHLIGEGLKQKFPHLRWIADFRDPWTTIGYHKHLLLTEYSQRKHKTLEKRILTSADILITTSQTTKEEFAKITNTPIEVITNGYDNAVQPKAQLSDTFAVSHIGSLLSARNPHTLWKVFADMIQTVEGFKDDFELVLAGKISSDILTELENLGLGNYITNKRYISHNEAVELQQKSQLLLLIEIDSEETKGIIPGKLFEYMVSGRPILAIGPEGWEAAQIVINTNTGKSVAYNDFDTIKTVLKAWHQQYKQGKLETHPVGLAPYSRRYLTKRLAEVIFRQ